MSNKNSNNNIEEPIIICPNCNDYIVIEKINCGIFRHATLKTNNAQINPHASKQECDYYINNELIYGCGKPFRIIQEGDKFVIQICEYI
jgi:hypothetical protein